MVRKFAVPCLLACLGIFAGAAPGAEPQTVTVTMTEYQFMPDHLTFVRDVHYRLHLENHGKETHEFTAPTFFGTAAIDNPNVLNRERTEVVMQPGETKDVFFTARRPGTYDLRCSDHDWAGMIGGITVK
jgi:uncharacterized cupredoxin-like copper-binding protein